MKNTQNIISANRTRLAQRANRTYHPDTGLGCEGSRTQVQIPGHGILYLPDKLIADTHFSLEMEWGALCRLRCRYDFEYWAYSTIAIRDKGSGDIVPFTLNDGQRKLLQFCESQRLADNPIRLIVLKARQWGCSTFVQTYMAWIQLCIKQRWNSITVAHNKDTANIIKAMTDNIIRNYPVDFIDADDDAPSIKSIGGSRNLYSISPCNSTYMLSTANSQSNGRGADLSMAHFSEVAYYRSSPGTSAANVIRSISSSIPLLPLSMVVVESTANGVNDYFHDEYMRALSGDSDKHPIFVAWHEIAIYTLPIVDYDTFISQMSEYEMHLFDDFSLTLEQINWYRHRAKEYDTPAGMKAEYPSDSVEAFNTVDASVFPVQAVEQLRNDCSPPQSVGEVQGNALTGPFALENIHFEPDPHGNLDIWKLPDNSCNKKHRYVAAVDIGGRSPDSDFSVIAVFDRADSSRPELVAQWRGHIDHDLLAWRAAAIAKWYNFATLIIESNTLETDRTEGDHGEFILHELRRHYRHLYMRDSAHPGFHTNRATKTHIINALISTIRQGRYIEHDDNALNEAHTFQLLPGGNFGAKEGFHDDIIMTRAMALSFCNDLHLIEQGRLLSAQDMRSLIPRFSASATIGSCKQGNITAPCIF